MQVEALAAGGPVSGLKECSPELQRFAGLLQHVMSQGNAYAGERQLLGCGPGPFRGPASFSALHAVACVGWLPRLLAP